MQVDTGAFEALTAEVERLTTAVQALVQREIAVREILEAGRAIGRGEIPAPRSSRPRRGRPGHLRPIDGTPGGGAA